LADAQNLRMFFPLIFWRTKTWRISP